MAHDSRCLTFELGEWRLKPTVDSSLQREGSGLAQRLDASAAETGPSVSGDEPGQHPAEHQPSRPASGSGITKVPGLVHGREYLR